MSTACHQEPVCCLKSQRSSGHSTLCNGWYRLVEFDIACSPDSGSCSSKRNNAVDVPVGLHQAETEPLDHRSIEGSYRRPLLPRKRPGRKSAVYHDGRNSLPVKGPEQIGPQLGFDEEIQYWLQSGDQARNDPGKIQRSIEMFSQAGQPLFDCFSPCFRDRRNNQSILRMALTEFLDQRCDCYHFTQRDCVDPDDRLVRLGRTRYTRQTTFKTQPLR